VEKVNFTELGVNNFNVGCLLQGCNGVQAELVDVFVANRQFASLDLFDSGKLYWNLNVDHSTPAALIRESAVSAEGMSHMLENMETLDKIKSFRLLKIGRLIKFDIMDCSLHPAQIRDDQALSTAMVQKVNHTISAQLAQF